MTMTVTIIMMLATTTENSKDDVDDNFSYFDDKEMLDDNDVHNAEMHMHLLETFSLLIMPHTASYTC